MAEKKKDKKFIQNMKMDKGAFTKKAARKGITSAQLQANVLANPDKYDEKTVKQANLRKTLVKLNKKKKISAELRPELCRYPMAKSKSDPCWDGYEKKGMKKKGGKMVNNCVPTSSKKKTTKKK